MVILARRYNPPVGKVGRRFVRALSDKLRGVQACRWNAVNFIIFQMVILQRARHITASHLIQRRTGEHLYAWEAEKNQMLVEETACMREQYLSTGLQDKSEEHQVKMFCSLVL